MIFDYGLPGDSVDLGLAALYVHSVPPTLAGPDSIEDSGTAASSLRESVVIAGSATTATAITGIVDDVEI